MFIDNYQKLREIDLYDLCSSCFSDLFKWSHSDARLKSNNSLTLQRGCNLYYDYGNTDGKRWGNAIDLLIEHLGYNFKSSVDKLEEYLNMPHSSLVPCAFPPPIPTDNRIIFPEAAPDNKRAIAYLTGRGINEQTVHKLIEKSLLYQDTHYNVCFCGANYYELRGTGQVSYHRCSRGAGGYWNVSNCEHPEHLYICEGSIDAISLMELHQIYSDTCPKAMYASIGGVAKVHAIHKLIQLCKEKNLEPVLAVDNDASGQQCRDNYPGIRAIIPAAANKDWNEILAGLSCNDIPTVFIPA